MRTFLKSKLMVLRQFPKRLRLEVRRPEAREDSATAGASFQVGQVSDFAQRIYDTEGGGVVIDAQSEGFDRVLAARA